MSTTATVLTADQLDQFPDDGKRREIIRGELHVSPAPTEKHQDLSMRLSNLLFEAINSTGAGKAYASPVDVRFSETDQVQPDLLAIREERLAIYAGGRTVHGAPDIVVEILSPSTSRYDQVEKLQLYQRGGVPEYWIVDPDALTLAIFRLTDGVYLEVEPVDGLHHSTAITDFAVDPAWLFRDISPE